MQRVAGMSVVVRAGGVSEAFYNGQRDRVVEAVRAEAEARIRQEKQRADQAHDWAKFQEQKSSRLQKEAMDKFLREQSRKPGLAAKLGEAAVMAWAYCWIGVQAIGHIAVTAWMYLWGYLYAWNLMDYDPYDDE